MPWGDAGFTYWEHRCRHPLCEGELGIPEAPTIEALRAQRRQVHPMGWYATGLSKMRKLLDGSTDLERSDAVMAFTDYRDSARQESAKWAEFGADARLPCPETLRRPIDDLVRALNASISIQVPHRTFFEASPKYRQAHLDAIRAKLRHETTVVYRASTAVEQAIIACEQGLPYEHARIAEVEPFEYPDLPIQDPEPPPDYSALIEKIRAAEASAPSQPSGGIFMVWYTHPARRIDVLTCADIRVGGIPGDLQGYERAEAAGRILRDQGYEVAQIEEIRAQDWSRGPSDQNRCGDGR